MSRINEFKKQHPYFNISIFEFFKKIDPTNSYKYYPILSRLFKDEIKRELTYRNNIDEIKEHFKYIGFPYEELSNQELIIYNSILHYIDRDNLKLVVNFISDMEKGLIDNKDVTSYKTINDIRVAISLSEIKKTTKELRNSIHTEFENDTWLAIRPLTFASSAKYGAATKWCTTSETRKDTFKRYWENGILVYFINKTTGYKFAGWKDLNENGPVSFWDVTDIMIDSMYLDIDTPMIGVIKNIFNSNQTNRNICSPELIEKVITECRNPKRNYEQDYVRFDGELELLEDFDNIANEISDNEFHSTATINILNQTTDTTLLEENTHLKIVYKDETKILGIDEE